MLSILMLYFWTASISLGVFYHMFGEKFAFIAFFIVIASRRKVFFNKNMIIGTTLFIVFIFIKGLRGLNINISNSYHSLWGQYVRIIELAGAFLMFGSLRKDPVLMQKHVLHNCKKIFLSCYYFTLIVTIQALLVRGRGLYRMDFFKPDLLYAPQFFLFYAVVISTALVSNIVSKKNERLKNITALLINTAFVLLMNYTTQIIFFFSAIFLVLLFKIFKKRDLVLVAIGLVTFFILFHNLISQMILYLNHRYFLDNADISMRLEEISKFLLSGDLSGKALGSRLDRMRVSWHSFLNYPMFGIPFSQYNIGKVLSVGGHHEWIDDMARFGVVGMSFFLYFVFQGFKAGIPILKRHMDDFSMIMLIVFIVYGFFNPFLDLSFLTACYAAILLVKTNMIEIFNGERR